MCLFHPRHCALQWQDQPCSRPSCSSSHPQRLLWPLILLPLRRPRGLTFGGDQRAKGPGTFQVRRTLKLWCGGGNSSLLLALPLLAWPKARDTQSVRWPPGGPTLFKDSSGISDQWVPLESLFRERHVCTPCCLHLHEWALPLVPTIWCLLPPHPTLSAVSHR